MSWRGVCTATPQQADPTSNPGLRANRARPPHGQDYHGPLRAESCTASTTAPRRLRRLGIASSPLKLWKIRRPHEPKPFGPALKHLHLLQGHAGDGPPAYLQGRLLMPQATERGRGTVAISGSRPWANHTARFYRESAALRGYHCPVQSSGGARYEHDFIVSIKIDQQQLRPHASDCEHQ